MINRYQIEVDCGVAVLFNADGVKNNSDVIEDYENYEWCKYSEVEQLQARIKELESAERTLNNLGYRNLGGELWKPPIGKKPDFSLIDSLNEKVKELKSEISKLGATCEEYSWKINKLEHVNYINEIKAQGIEEAIKKADNETYIGIVGQEFPPQSQYKSELLCYAEQLRTKHD